MKALLKNVLKAHLRELFGIYELAFEFSTLAEDFIK